MAGVAGDVLEPRSVRVRDRLVARLRAHTLDARLAAGVPPERSAALSLRAARLIQPAVGIALGRRIDIVIDQAEGHVPARARVAARRRAVFEAGAELAALSRRLAAPEPRAARGVAQVRLLLTDGTGPLYSPRAGEELRAAIRRARAALEVI